MAKVDKSALHDFVDGTQVTENELDQNFEVLRVAHNDTEDKLATHKTSADHDDRYYTEDEINQIVQGITAGQIQPNSITREMLAFDPAATDQPNTWAESQVFAKGIQDGDSNQDISLQKSLVVPIDTRSLVATAWNESGKVTTLELRDADVTVPATLDFTNKVAGDVSTVPHVGYFGSFVNGSAPPAPGAITMELTTAYYQLIASADGSPLLAQTSTETNVRFVSFRFSLLSSLKLQGKIPQSWTRDQLVSALHSHTVTWIGYGSGANAGATTAGSTVKVWNPVAMTWDSARISTSNVLSAVSFTVNSGYVDTDGNVHILIQSTYPSDGTIPSSVYTDSIKVAVEVNVPVVVATAVFTYNQYDLPTQLVVTVPMPDPTPDIVLTFTQTFEGGWKFARRDKVVTTT